MARAREEALSRQDQDRLHLLLMARLNIGGRWQVDSQTETECFARRMACAREK